MSIVPMIFSAGWASGVNAYAVVLLLGLLGRFAGVEGVPPALQRTDVLVAAALLFALEAVADKVPYLDSVWDAVHTVVRPVVGGTVSALLAGQDPHITVTGQTVAAVVGGLLALGTHLVKSGLRLGVNASPEPVSTFIVSSGEDLAVAAVIAVGAVWPWVAAAMAAALLVTGVIVLALLWHTVRRVLLRRRTRRGRGAPVGEPAA